MELEAAGDCLVAPVVKDFAEFGLFGGSFAWVQAHGVMAVEAPFTLAVPEAGRSSVMSFGEVSIVRALAEKPGFCSALRPR